MLDIIAATALIASVAGATILIASGTTTRAALATASIAIVEGRVFRAGDRDEVDAMMERWWLRESEGGCEKGEEKGEE